MKEFEIWFTTHEGCDLDVLRPTTGQVETHGKCGCVHYKGGSS